MVDYFAPRGYPAQQPAFPPPEAEMTPEERQSVLGRMYEASLGGLGYIGKLLDKTFGGRAVRGLLGGRPEELLSILPLSDTFGITNDANVVQGTDLLSDAGLITRGDNGFLNTVAGLGVEMALDPSTYVGIGPYTKAGQAAVKAGTATKGLAAGIRAGERGLVGLGLPFHRPVDDLIFGAAQKAMVPADGTLSLFRGVQPGRDAYGMTDTVGRGLFYTPNESLAKAYSRSPAGEFGQVVNDAVGMKNPLIADTWVAAKQKLGIPQATMRELVDAAGAAGHDVLSFTTGNGQEYVVLNKSALNPMTEKAISEGAAPLVDAISRYAGQAVSKPLDAAEWAARPLESIFGVNPVAKAREAGAATGRAVGALFDPVKQGAYTTPGQDIAENVYTSTLRQYGKPGKELFGDVAETVTTLGQKYGPEAQQDILRAMTLGIELPNDITPFVKRIDDEFVKTSQSILSKHAPGQPLPPAAQADLDAAAATRDDLLNRLQLGQQYRQQNDPTALLAKHLSPDELAVVQGKMDAARMFLDTALDERTRKGIKSAELQDIINYLPRQKQSLGRGEGEGLLNFLKRRASEGSAASDPTQIRRLEALRNLPGGTDQWEQIVADPALRAMGKDAKEARLREILSGTADPAKSSPVWKQAEEMRGLLDSLDPRFGQDGQKYFTPDTALVLKQYGEGYARKMAITESVYDGASRFSLTKAELDAKKMSGVRVGDLLDRIGADSPSKAKQVWEPIANKLGVPLKDVADRYVPADVAADMMRMGVAWKSPEALAPVVAAYDMALNMFKTGVTAPFPSFYVRNLLGGLFNSWRGEGLGLKSMGDTQAVLRGGLLSPETTAELAAKLPEYFKGKTVEQATAEFKKLALGYGVAFGREGQVSGDLLGGTDRLLPYQLPDNTQGVAKPLKDVASDFASILKPQADLKAQGYGTARQYLDPFAVEGVGATENVNRVIAAGRAVGRQSEDFLRGSHFLEKMKQGFKPEVAAEEVAKYHIDYCVDESTEAMTKRGWLGVNDIKEGDYVLTINPKTKAIEWQKASAINVFSGVRSLTKWENQTFSAVTTDAHRWLVRGSGSRGGHHSLPREDHHFGTTGEITKKGSGRKYQVLITGGGDPSACPEKAIHSNEFVELVGWYVADGFDPNDQWGAMISQSRSANPDNCKAIERIRRHFESEGFVCTQYRDRESSWGVAVVWRFGKGVGEEVRLAAPSRRMTFEFMNSLTREQVAILLEAIRKGKGGKNGKSAVYSEDLHIAERVQYLCSLLGKRTCVRKSGTVYRVAVYSATGTHTGELKMEKVKYRGVVWCPTTANGTWLARRKGMTYWTGNSNLTEFEKNVMKRLAPWYSFARRNLPPILEDLASQPAKIAQTTRAITGARDPEQFTPQYIAEGASFPLGQSGPGTNRFISSFGLPVEDEAIKTIGSALSGDYRRVLQQVGGMGLPYIKAPAEIAFDTQLYSGRRLSDLEPSTVASLGGLLPDQAAQFATQFVANTPFARGVSTIDRMLDSRKGLGTAALNTLTGLRVSDVDTERARLAAERQMLQDLLRPSNRTRVREEVYVPKDQLEKLTPDERFIYEMMKGVQRDAQKYAKRAKE